MKSAGCNSEDFFRDPVLIRGAYEMLLSENHKQQDEIERQKAIISEQQLRLAYLEQEYKLLQRLIFGSKSERFIPTDYSQLSLDLDVEEKALTACETETITYTRCKEGKEKKPGHSRLPIPSYLPRIEHIIEPEEDLTGARKIGEEITEILNYEPGRFYVDKFIRNKYALPEEKGIVIGMLPSLPIPKGNAGAGLLTQILVGKYVDHLPFHRHIEIFKRQGIEIPESTMNDWFRKSSELVTVLYDRLKHIVKQSSYIQVDESPIPVQTRDKKGATHKGYEWVYHAVEEKLVCFDYQKNRSREGPEKFLAEYKGVVQSDGYSSYHFLEREKHLILLACMAHARRKFFEAKDNDQSRSIWMIDKIKDLYQVEQESRDKFLSCGQRKALRQEKSLPILIEIEQWLKENIVKTLPKSAIGQAIAYTLNLWPRLKQYIDDGRFEIDNNLIENTIRPLALGRKNYMFAGSHEAAQKAAVMYSLFGSCKLNDVEPYTWLKTVLERLPDTRISEVDSLLPNFFKKSDNSR